MAPSHSVLLALLLLFSSVWATSTSFLFEEKDLIVPIQIKVILAGFIGYNIQELQQLVEDSFSFHSPYILQKQTKLPKYFINYNFISISSENYEQAVAQVISKQMQQNGFQQNFTILPNDMVVKNALEEYQQTNNSKAYSILLINPNKQSILQKLKVLNPNLSAKDITYTYKFQTSLEQLSAASWVSEKKYVVFDFGVGPVSYGSTNAEVGLFQYNNSANTALLFSPSLSKIIISAVRQVFIPDVGFGSSYGGTESLQTASKVLVPIIIFKDHNYFNPLVDSSTDLWKDCIIDLSTVKKEITKVFSFPTTDISVVTGIHDLHEHPHIALALEKSIRSHTIHEFDENNYRVKTNNFIDSDVLISNLRSHSEDLLTGGLLSLSTKHKNIFFNPKLPDPQLTLNNFTSTIARTKSQGVQILPVFIFSLFNHDMELMLDRQGLSAVFEDTVLILQSNSTGKTTYPYCAGIKNIHINPRQITNHIMAGIMSVLIGTVDLCQHYSSAHGKIVRDFTWAFGYHPFCPFSQFNYHQVSEIFTDIGLRNLILIRINNAVSKIKESITLVDAFAKEFLYKLFRDDLQHSGSRWTNWIDQIFHQYFDQESGVLSGAQFENLSPDVLEGIYQLHQELKNLEKLFDKAAFLIYQNNWEEALKLSSSFETTGDAFNDYARNKLNELHHQLTCCSLVSTQKPSDSAPGYLILLVGIICVGALVSFIKASSRKK